MKLKFILPVLCLLASITANCQEKFVEVIVSDTMMITPDRFIYGIVAKPQENNFDFESKKMGSLDYEKIKAKESGKQKQRIDSLRNILSQKGFAIYGENNEVSYNKIDETTPYYLQVNVSSQDSLAILYSLIKNNATWYGYVVSRKAAGEDVYMQKLWQRIMQVAKQKANALAVLGGLQLGNVTQVKETAKNEERGWTAYPPLSSEDWVTSVVPGWHTTILPNTLQAQYKIEEMLTVRFEVK